MTRWLALVVLVAGCDGAPPSPAKSDAGPGEIEFLPRLENAGDLDALKGSAGDTKFLAQVEGVPVTAPILAPCEFQNTAKYSFHLPFLNAQPGGADITFDEYVDDVIRRAHRVWWGGEVVFLPAAAHPLTQQPGVLAWTLYTEDSNGNRLTLDDVRAGFARLVPCTPAFAGKLAFSPSSSEQVTTVTDGQDALAADGIAVLLP